jgi:hypothetical protein
VKPLTNEQNNETKENLSIPLIQSIESHDENNIQRRGEKYIATSVLKSVSVPKHRITDPQSVKPEVSLAASKEISTHVVLKSNLHIQL